LFGRRTRATVNLVDSRDTVREARHPIMTTPTDVTAWYTASNEPELTAFGTVHGQGITGTRGPGGLVHLESIRTLVDVASALLDLAGRAGASFAMPAMEGRWWVEDDRPPFDVPRAEWCWQLYFRLPDDLPAPLFDVARETAAGGPSGGTRAAGDVHGGAVRTDRSCRRIRRVTANPGEDRPPHVRGAFETKRSAPRDPFVRRQ
jgi:hypothetical protein